MGTQEGQKDEDNDDEDAEDSSSDSSKVGFHMSVNFRIRKS